MQISLLCLLKVNREENNMIKYKVRDVAKDLGVSVKEISDILEKNCEDTKKGVIFAITPCYIFVTNLSLPTVTISLLSPSWFD